MPGPQTEFCLLRESVGVSRINHILQVHSSKRARDIACPAHLGALVAAKPRILAVIQGAPLVTHLAADIEAATTTYLEALDGEEKPTAKLNIQKAAKSANEAWQQTVQRHNGPTVTNPRVSEIELNSSVSRDYGDDDDDLELTSASPRKKNRLSAPQLQAQLSRLSDRTRLRRLKTLCSKGAGHHVTRIEDLCHTRVSLGSGSVTWTHARAAYVQRRTTRATRQWPARLRPEKIVPWKSNTLFMIPLSEKVPEETPCSDTPNQLIPSGATQDLQKRW